MATLIDARIVGRPLWLVDRDQPGRGVEIHVKRLEIASEDCEAEWCRLFGVTDSAGWPPVTTEPSRANPGGTGEGTAPVEMVLGLVADRLHLLDGRDAADVAEDLLAGDLEELAAVSSWCALITRVMGGEPDASAWAARALLGTGPAPEPVSPLLARVLAVVFEAGWEPRRSPQNP